MSVREGLGIAPEQTKKSGAVLVFLPLLIALLVVTAIYLGSLATDGSAGVSGYGIDDLAMSAAVVTPAPDSLIQFDR